MGECWETHTEWETVGTGILNARVPGRSVPVIHSVALCWAFSHELALENNNKKKNLIFFFFLTSVSLGAGGTSSAARADAPGLTPQSWQGVFARVPPTPTCCKITFFIFNHL